MRGFGIQTCLELKMLSERQLAEIWRPRPETDAYVLTHPDLADYVAREIDDKRRRLDPALKMMGVELDGPRLSYAELLAVA